MSTDWLQTQQVFGVNAPNAPIVYYDFNETSGSIAFDSAGPPFYNAIAKLENGTVTNALWEPAGKFNGCIRFQQYDRYGEYQAKVYCLEMPNSPFIDYNITSKITISVWVNWDEHLYGWMPDEHNQMFSMDDASGGILGIQTGWPDRDLEFWDAAQDGHYGADRPDWSGRWNHYAFVKNANAGFLRIFLNGRLVDQASSSQLMGSPVVLARIGVATDRWHDEYTGLLDDFKIFDYALPVDQVAFIASEGTGFLPLTSHADLYDGELPGSKTVNFRDYAILANHWLEYSIP